MTEVPANRCCPRCGKECRPEEMFCLHRDQELSKSASHRLAIGQFSLAFLLVVTFVIAVTLGVYRLSPDVAVALAIVLVPALAAFLRRRRGGQMSAPVLGITFLVSLAAMIPVLTVAFAGFLLGCGLAILTSPLLALEAENPRYVVLLVGAATALAGACYGFWVTRPHE